MPPKRKGAAAENKNEAPPAKTIKDEEAICQYCPKTSTGSYEDSYEKAICNLMKNIACGDAEVFWDIVVGAIVETVGMELMKRRSEKPDDKVEDLADLKLIGEAEKRFGPYFKCLLVLHIMKHQDLRE